MEQPLSFSHATLKYIQFPFLIEREKDQFANHKFHSRNSFAYKYVERLEFYPFTHNTFSTLLAIMFKEKTEHGKREAEGRANTYTQELR